MNTPDTPRSDIVAGGALVRYHETGYPALTTVSDQTTLPARRPTRGTDVVPRIARTPQRTRRLAVTAAGAAVALLLVAGMVVVIGAGRTQQPAVQVQAMFTALTNRDGDQLRQLIGCHTSPLCTSQGLSTGYQPPDQVNIRKNDTGATPDPDHVVLTVTYRLAGADHTDEVGLTRYRHGLFGHRWRITEPPGRDLTIGSVRATDVHLGGIDLPTSARDMTGTHGNQTVWAPPGIITATVDGDDLFAPATLDITVPDSPKSGPVLLPANLKPGIVEDADRQIRARIDACAAQQRLRPNLATSLRDRNSCPFGYDSPYSITEQPRWTIQRYPTIDLHVQDDSTITVNTTTAGAATITYRWTLDILEPKRWTRATDTQAITINGHITAENGTITWTT